MSATATRAKPVPYFEANVTTDIDVEIDPDDLHDAGWHHENECNLTTSVVTREERDEFTDAIASLHRQAHPKQALDPARCREEPCRSLYTPHVWMAP